MVLWLNGDMVLWLNGDMHIGRGFGILDLG
jgi:hypothetical protein